MTLDGNPNLHTVVWLGSQRGIGIHLVRRTSTGPPRAEGDQLSFGDATTKRAGPGSEQPHSDQGFALASHCGHGEDACRDRRLRVAEGIYRSFAVTSIVMRRSPPPPINPNPLSRAVSPKFLEDRAKRFSR